MFEENLIATITETEDPISEDLLTFEEILAVSRRSSIVFHLSVISYFNNIQLHRPRIISNKASAINSDVIARLSKEIQDKSSTTLIYKGINREMCFGGELDVSQVQTNTKITHHRRKVSR